MNTVIPNKDTKDFNSFKVQLVNANLHTGKFDFLREHALCFYPEAILKLSDAVRQSAYFSGAHSNVSVSYGLETVVDDEQGRIVFEDISLAVVPDYHGIKPFMHFELNYVANRNKAPNELPELRRDGFNMMVNKFTDANKRKTYFGPIIEGEEDVAREYDTTAAQQHLRNLLASLSLSDYRLFAEFKPDNSLVLQIWSLDYKFVLGITVQPGM